MLYGDGTSLCITADIIIYPGPLQVCLGNLFNYFFNARVALVQIR